MQSKTILVTGANGQLGNKVREVATESTADRYIFTDVAELDITDYATIEQMVQSEGVDIIINCAAYTNVDKAEEDGAMAELLNATAAANLARAMAAVDGTLIHISTDYVFGATQKNTPYDESESANPIGVYGVTKLHGEQQIAESGCRYLILRTAWLYSEYGKNFVKTMLDLTLNRPTLKVVFDQCGTPTYAGDLAAAIFHIVEHRLYEEHTGVYHYSNEGVCSWFDFTKMIAEIAGHNACDIQPCHSNEFPSKVTRPSYSVLDKSKIKQMFGVEVPYWTDSLKKCINNLLKHEI